MVRLMCVMALAACGGGGAGRTDAGSDAGPIDAPIDAPRDATSVDAVHVDALEGDFITITPSSKDFGTSGVGQPTVATTFTVSNAGAHTTAPLAVALGGANPGSFTIASDGCIGQPIAAGSSCSIAVVFRPLVTGSVSASLAVTGPNVVSAAMSGTGVVGPDLAINPSILDFGAVPVVLHSAPTDFTVTNSGSIATGTPSVALGGVNPSSFEIVASTCAAAIAPGATCTVTVRFWASLIGNRAATLAVTATPGGTATASLLGQGISNAALQASPNVLGFGDVAVGTSATLTVMVTNPNSVATGPIAATFSGTDKAMFQSVASTCTTLAPNATCAIDIAFSPTSLGLKTAAISLTTPVIAGVSVAVSGAGI
jgi:hypothetical protein